MSQPVLTVRDLVIEFDTPKGRRRVVDHVGFEVRPGEVLGILGESGSGKTMTTLSVLGLVAGLPGVMGGQITFDGGNGPIQLLKGLQSVIKSGQPPRKNSRRWQRMVHRRMKPLWGHKMTAVFQNPRQSLDPLMTVGDQVAEAVSVSASGLSKEERRLRALSWLERVQMPDPQRVYRAYPHELSGGMCQRAMIAVAMACTPLLLVADEPTTGLDATVRAEIVELFKDLLADRQGSMLYISHDIREVLYLADRVIVMKSGQVVERASTDDLRHHRGTRHPYTASLLAAADLGERPAASATSAPAEVV
ncbi:MAG: ABC transporter ATP-binding protein [Bradymonadia bacterium]